MAMEDRHEGTGMQKSLDPRMAMATPVAPQSYGQRPEDDDEIDLLALVRTLWRGKWWIILCAMIAVGIGGWYAYRIAVPTYTATTQMALQIRQESVVDLQSVLSGVSSDQSSINTEMEIIRSRELISALVDRLDLMSDPEFNATLRPDDGFGPRDVIALVRQYVPGLEAPLPAAPPSEEAIRNGVIGAVRNAISTQIGRQSYVFSISATTESARKSALLANTLAQIYKDDQVAQKVQATENAAVWLSGRVSELQADLEARQRQITTLRTERALVSAESVQALNTQSVELQQTLQAAEAQLEEARTRSAALQAALAGDNATKLAAVQDVQLAGIYDAIERGDASAQIRFDRRFESLRLQASTEVLRLEETVTELQSDAERLGRQFTQQSEALANLQELERETEATRVLYETFLTRLKETTVQEGVHQADSRILSEATPGQQVAPRKSRILALSMILGVMAGSAIVLMREFMQNTYRTSEELERATGLTVLGQIPRIPARGRQATVEYVAAKPTSAPAEAIRNLRTSVLLSNVDNPPKIIMSTSSIPGEGKTTLAIALAQNLAGLDKKVILIEGDIRRRTFGEYFPQAREKGGLLSVISGKMPLEQAVWRPERGRFDVLMGERSSINAADTFSSEAFRSLIEKVRDDYDYAIIDTPPVLVVPDSRVIGQLVDAIIYSVNWDRTTRTQVQEGLRQFQTVNLRVTGLVLSQIDPAGMKRYGYGDKYGAYSRYSKGYYDS
jgi:capsular exopolysaccharide synthesis family protein